jgi:hypothetical protein
LADVNWAAEIAAGGEMRRGIAEIELELQLAM